MQDQQKQTRDQHNDSYSCYGQYQRLRRRVVTYTLAFHGQSPIKKMVAALTLGEDAPSLER